MIDVGTKIALRDRSEPYTVVRYIAGGGEGDVFELRGGGERKALKWYHERVSSPERRAHLAALVERGAPSPSFLWPIGLIEDDESGRFGYIMDFRPEGYVDIGALLRSEVPRRELSVIRFCFELAQSYLALHTAGLCYRDINFGNAFYHPETGRAMICDNDNVGIEGVDQSLVLGQQRFMAPEILGHSKQPSKYTDRFSLAVLLFYLLVGRHPLDGAKTHDIGYEPAARMKFYVLDPLFCFDPDDSSNRPVPGDGLAPEVVWASYPERIRALFTRSFTAGLHEPTERVVDAEWCDALSELEDRYLECSTCRGPCYLEGDRPPARCAYCASPTREVVALCFDRKHVVVRDQARVVADRVRHDFDYETAVGTVEPHPSIAGLYGLRNDTEQSWTYRDTGGTIRVVAPGKRGSLVVGAELDLGGQWARVVSLGSDRRCCR